MTLRKLLAFAFAVFFSCACARAEEAKPELLYFYVNYCDACEPETEFAGQFLSLTGESTGAYACHYYNTAREAGARAYREALQKYALSEEEALLPLLIVDGRVYAGTQKINLELPKYAVSASGDAGSAVYYLYVSACESCREAEGYIEAAPERIEVTRGDYAFSSDLEIIRVNIGEDTALAYALFDAYHVPEDKRVSPMALAGQAYYSGVTNIQYLMEYGIYRGAALGTLRVLGDVALPYVGLGGAALAGLVGGLNPCALSMLLLFLSLLLQSPGNARAAAAAFLAAKFLVYFLIGTVLLSVFQAWNPTWLPLASRILLTALSVFLIVLNLWDARQLKKGEYGLVRNQLPRGARKRLNERIQRAMTGRGRYMVPACMLLGAVVAAGEFLCAGQVYLATLLATVRTGARGTAGYALLLAYCACFLLPAALVCALAIRGKSVLALSEGFRKRMPLVKALSALTLALIAALSWIL